MEIQLIDFTMRELVADYHVDAEVGTTIEEYCQLLSTK